MTALLLLFACQGKAEGDALMPEPLELPDDPAQTGVPVGVRTEWVGEVGLEIWYPATNATRGAAGEAVDPGEWIPESVEAVLGEIALPTIPTIAVRDADLRIPADEAYPLVLFSHGFGGFRAQSVDLTTHLASRGYVVAAIDHPGRMLGDVLPCLFLPPLEGCDLSGFGQDPGPDDLRQALDHLVELGESGFLAGALRADALGVAGHSAGAGSTTSFGEDEAEVRALLPMAGGAAVEREVPSLFMGGSCDPYPGIAAVEASAGGSADGLLLSIEGAGHLAFSDLCTLDLGRFAEELLAGREDINAATLDALLLLATDGCPGARPQAETGCEEFLPLQTSGPIIRHYATSFFDLHLRAEGEGPQPGAYAEGALSRP